MTKLFWVVVIIVVLMLIPANTKKDDIEAGLAAVLKKYGEKTAKDVERIYRKETAHFASRQYLLTFSPGMEVHAEAFPYGWSSMKEAWIQNPSLAPNGKVAMHENNTTATKTFLSFPSVTAAMLSLALYLQKYRPGRWYSTNASAQEKYESELAQITPRIVNELTA